MHVTKRLGVLGGMGSAATVRFLDRLITFTPAHRDQDHVPAIVSFAPAIPDRSTAILGQGESPLDALLRETARLERAGADVICIPCNTAHYWYDAVCSACTVPLLHIVDAVSNLLVRSFPSHARIGLISTSGTLASQIYQHRNAKCRWFTPDPLVQALWVDPCVALVKGGDLLSARVHLHVALQHLIKSHAVDAVVLGCTDLILAIPNENYQVPILDSGDALAIAALESVGSKVALSPFICRSA